MKFQEIGSVAYYADLKDKTVESVEIVGANISDTGYLLYSIIKSDGSTKTTEEAHLHLTYKEAEKHLEEKGTLRDVGKSINELAVKEIDDLRLQIIGEPTLLEIANRIKGDK